jgi:hypothetical protein
MQYLKIVAILLGILVGNLLFWGTGLGPVALVLGVGAAIAGAGNRLVWALGAGALALITAGTIYTLRPFDIDATGVFGGMVACAMVPLVPALLFWGAFKLRAWRQPKPAA